MDRIGKLLIIISVALAFCGAARAQGTASTIRHGTTLPATCVAGTGQVFYLTSGAVGLYACNTTNTWTLNPAACTSTVGGQVPTPPNDGSQFLDGTCNFSTPANTAGRVVYAAATQYGLPATGYNSCNASWSGSSTTVTTVATDPIFTVAMIGWTIWGVSKQCQTFDNSGAYQVPIGTITSINNSHSANISTTTSGSCTSGVATGCQLWWVPADSSAALNAAFSDVLLPTGCTRLVLPAGVYGIGSAIVKSGTQSCSFQSGFGDAETERTYDIAGQGVNATTLAIYPTFNGNTCLADTIISQTVCLFGTNIQAGVTIHDLSVDGTGINSVTNAGGCVFAGNYLSNFYNLAVWNWGYTSGMVPYCLVGNRNGNSYASNIWAYGDQRCILTLLGPTTIFGAQCSVNGTSLTVNCSSGATTTYGGSFQSQGQEFEAVVVNAGCPTAGGWSSHDDLVNNEGTNTVGIIAHSNIFLDRTTVVGGSGASAAALNLQDNAIVWANSSSFDNQVGGTGFAFNAAGGSGGEKFFDLGGNILGELPNLAGMTFLPFGGAAGSMGINAQLSGVSACVSSQTLFLFPYGQTATSTCSSATAQTAIGGYVAPRAATLYDLVFSAGTGGVAGDKVTVNVNGVATAITCTYATATSCQDTTHSVVVALGDLISFSITTGVADTTKTPKASVILF